MSMVAMVVVLMALAVYVVYPAFFTDVTQSYRLGRGGRVRTDLGGVYFNALTIVGLTALYAQTHSSSTSRPSSS